MLSNCSKYFSVQKVMHGNSGLCNVGRDESIEAPVNGDTFHPVTSLEELAYKLTGSKHRRSSSGCAL